MATTFTVANLTDVGELSTVFTFGGTSGTMTSSGTALVTPSGAFALTLPTSTQISPGQCCTIKKTETGGSAITVTPPSGQIDGAATATISGGSRGKNTFLWDGVNWWVVV